MAEGSQDARQHDGWPCWLLRMHCVSPECVTRCQYRVHSTCEAMTTNMWECGGHTVYTCYRIYRYRTGIPYATVTEYTGTEPTYRMQLLQNIPIQNRHTVCNCYRIYRYRTGIPYTPVTEYTGTEPAYRMQLLQNIPVQNRHTVYNCYRIYWYRTDIPYTSYRINRYRTDIPYTTVIEYNGTEPTYHTQLLQNKPVQNRHTVCNCYRI